MKAILLYLLLTKATITSFSGLASLPVLREDLVVHRHLLTDAQVDTAVVVSRTTPGPIGVYVVSVGYFAGGILGAIAGWLAMITPGPGDYPIAPLVRPERGSPSCSLTPARRGLRKRWPPGGCISASRA